MKITIGIVCVLVALILAIIGCDKPILENGKVEFNQVEF